MKISPEKSKQNFPENKPIVLTCSGENFAPKFFTHYKWFNPRGELINSDDNFELLPTNTGALSLIISNPTLKDSGEYRCQALFQLTININATIKVDIFKEITWDDCNPNQFLIEGSQDGKIYCRVSSLPPPELHWRKDFRKLNNDSYSIENDGLRIKGPVQYSHAGSYEINAFIKTLGFLRKQIIKVKVHTFPKIIDLEKARDVVENERVEILCKASGSPAPIYTWLDKHKRNIKHNLRYEVNSDRGVLTILKVKKSEDDGTFYCVAKNDAGEASQAITLKVLKKPEIVHFENISVAEGQSKEWACRASGFPDPVIKIFKFGENETSLHSNLRQESNFDNIDKGMVEAKYIFRDVKRQNDGLYYCQASNKAGSTTQIGHFEVQYKPDLSLTKSDVKTWENNSVNLTCIAQSIPNSTYSWIYRSFEIKSGDHYHIYNEHGISRLLVNPKSGYDLYGPYTCRARNQLGEASTIIRLSQALRPESPNVYIDTIRPTYVIITLQPYFNQDLPIKTIYIKYWKDDEPEGDAKIVSRPVASASTVNDFKLEDLTPRATYHIRVAAASEAGLGSYTEIKVVSLPRESIPESPLLLFESSSKQENYERKQVIYWNSGDKIFLRWSQPEDNGLIIDHYQIRYYKVEKKGSDWERISEPKERKVSAKDPFEFHFNHLSSNSFYKIEISSHNSLGYSNPPSMVLFSTPKGKCQVYI